ncbi:hypothetical protein [Paenibacillus sp. BAC0078]
MLIFKDFHRLILNFYLDPSEEAMILNCFTDKDHFLLFPRYGLDRYGYDPETVNFIKERTEYIESNFVYWYSPRNLEELKGIITDEGVCYDCRVASKVNNEVKFRFKLEKFEHYGYPEEAETTALIINEEEEGDYIRNIAPLIRKAAGKFYQEEPR